MSKIVFDDKSSVEIKHSDKPDHVVIVISAIDGTNKNKKITNACEITAEEFAKLMSDIRP
jgi:hypothetical protein